MINLIVFKAVTNVFNKCKTQTISIIRLKNQPFFTLFHFPFKIGHFTQN